MAPKIITINKHFFTLGGFDQRAILLTALSHWLLVY